ncbi:hypothetical protein [Streptomyces caeruleatus]|uniref:Uncharacterized protein n=1 Tax=Streptomyces caeruleatus TaxID=661399 RepID=A0A124I638_9ACTN|nr:hypothetical protein [Streptomyces caeruleatus]KUN91890.1 hypothetical protein AQJ67_41405 [Streptomyces caeruleatus]
MTDHFARPLRAASSERVAELHRLADADYAKGQQERATPHLAPSYAAHSMAGLGLAPEPTDLDVAIRVAQQLLDSSDAVILRESLRILLRALGAEPLTADEAVRRSVDAQFPTIAAFLADERGGQ